MSTATVNASAGMKSAPRKRKRASSPDIICKTTVTPAAPLTMGEIFDAEVENEEPYPVVTHLSNSGMKMKIKSSQTQPKIAKPQYEETKSTPFEIINIHGNIAKCAGCKGKLKEGPDPLLSSEHDHHYCIRHKERDHVFIAAHNYWKQTFSNKHYHLLKECVLKRNKSFISRNVQINVAVDREVRELLKERFGN